MTGEYQTEYSEHLSGEGREVRVSDGTINYYYDFPAGDTMDDVATSFAETYDHNGITGSVRCYAEEYVDGERVGERHYFTCEYDVDSEDSYDAKQALLREKREGRA